MCKLVSINHMTQVNQMANPKGNPATLKHYIPKWKAGTTRTIRVPVALADQILDYAHKIDNDSLAQVNHNGNGDSPAIAATPQDDNLNETLTQVIQAIEQVCEAPHTGKFTKLLKAKLQENAITPLKALIQVNEDVEVTEN